MPKFRTNRRVRHSARDMFALVADVESYPQFVPLCMSLRIRKREALADGREILLADMEVGYSAIRERFVSRVTLDPQALEILVEYVDGPFSRLQNRWLFADVEEGASNVEFFIDYEFKSRTLGLLMGSMFESAFRKFSQAFEARANRVYRTA